LGVIHYEEDRMITIREGLRFQSFPDDFQLISKTQRNYYVQVGNAVPPLLSKAWAEHLLTYLVDIPSPKAIHIAKSHESQTQKPKLVNEYVFANAQNETE
jgi:DNA (cytosine-5)-methyltransferase 1